VLRVLTATAILSGRLRLCHVLRTWLERSARLDRRPAVAASRAISRIRTCIHTTGNHAAQASKKSPIDATSHKLVSWNLAR